MSFVTSRRHGQRFWNRWLFGLQLAAMLSALVLWLPNLAIGEEPAEPDDLVIVSDDGDEGKMEPAADAGETADTEQSPAADSTDESADEVAPAEADATTEPAADTEEDETESTVKSAIEQPAEEESADDEVAPLAKPAPEVPPPADDATDASDESADTAADAEDSEADGEPGVVTAARNLKSQKKSGHKSSEAAESQPVAHSRPPVEGASFKGILPGKTTVAEMEETWGPAKEVKKTASGIQQVFYLKPFKQVVAAVVDGKVDTVLVHLDKPFEPAVLAKQLTLDDVEPVMIYNGKGQLLGQAFPERGVLFGFAPETSPPAVAQIVIEPINSQPFVTRAEKNARSRPADALADVDFAIEIDPEFDRAHAVRARALCELGDLARAKKEAEKAVSLSPHEAEFRLTLAKILLQHCDYASAASEAQLVIKSEKASTLMRAQAQQVWGDALAAGPDRNFEQALKQHTEAIQLAEEVVAKCAGPMRRAAKELLIDSHLAIAHDIAWGNWQQKSKVVPKWIERADAFCDHYVIKEKGDPSARLRVYEGTLAAYAGMKDAPDATATIDSLTKLGRQLLAEEKDPTRRHMLQWRLGEAMTNAMLVAQAKEKADAALQYGQQAVAYFKQSGNTGEDWPGHDNTLGRVYYRLGAIHAVGAQEHKAAIIWYDKAAPLLEAPAPASAAADLGRQGEMFVSMAVSYWEAGTREEAIRLTQQGAKLMEQAVSEERLPKTALAVPYGNLASMHQELGDGAKSKKFSEMAAKLDTIRR